MKWKTEAGVVELFQFSFCSCCCCCCCCCFTFWVMCCFPPAVLWKEVQVPARVVIRAFLIKPGGVQLRRKEPPQEPPPFSFCD